MSFCPEAEYRASLDDADFWAHVLGNNGFARMYGVGSMHPTEVPCSCASVGHFRVLSAGDPSHEDYDPAGNDQEPEDG